ncbi:hypothetical protein GCM10009613_01130 [Pseudonocardia kongjuensis]|uniref:Cyclohexanecarboxylate-CoA ligase n=1 Tax=Pseudonocardia kongjuensis TaxID=102227 RepID=A0ABN1XIK6_9PSEU
MATSEAVRGIVPTFRLPADQVARYRAAGYWRDASLPGYLARCAERFPDRRAVVDGDRVRTFGQLWEEARSVAGALRDLGLRRGEVVGFQLPNWIEALPVHFGTLLAGGVANPIPPILREREVGFILRQTGARFLVGPESFRRFDFSDMYRRLADEAPALEHVALARTADPDDPRSLDRWLRAPAPPAADLLPLAGRGDEAAIVLYTSGTTADPKGAVHTHDGFACGVRHIGELFGLNENDRLFNPSPITHTTGLTVALTLPVLTGCSVVLQDVWEPEGAFDAITRDRSTFMIFATPFLAALTDIAEARDVTLDHVRAIACGGADVPESLAGRARSRLGEIVRIYGATEANATTCGSPWDPADKKRGTEGTWIHPTVGRVVAVGTDDPVPNGTVGEIQWQAPQMCQGYLDAGLNAAAFTDDGYFRTGDLGVLDAEGFLTVRGRIKDIINRGGEKISAREIEDLLYEHPSVHEVAVTPMPDPVLGEKICAWVVPVPGAPLSLTDVTAHLSGYGLARQKLPERLELVDELPRTASGKIQKFVLRDRLGGRR